MNAAVQTSQVLSSSNLVNRSVLVPASSVSFDGSDAVKGAVNVTSTGPVTVQVQDASGNVLRTMSLGTQGAGLSQFTWDGKDDSGNVLPAGSYTLAASSGSTTLNTYVAGTVTGVGYGGSSLGTYLQVSGVGGVSLSQVAQIL
nr:FlgD immunoglobulin-like domain containing protein [Dyella sp. ASV21]